MVPIGTKMKLFTNKQKPRANANKDKTMYFNETQGKDDFFCDLRFKKTIVYRRQNSYEYVSGLNIL